VKLKIHHRKDPPNNAAGGRGDAKQKTKSATKTQNHKMEGRTDLQIRPNAKEKAKSTTMAPPFDALAKNTRLLRVNRKSRICSP
jgi:hypothetical protein